MYLCHAECVCVHKPVHVTFFVIIYVCTHVYLCACMCVRVHGCMRECVCACACMRACVHVCMGACVCVHVCGCVHCKCMHDCPCWYMCVQQQQLANNSECNSHTLL